jgi:lipoyl(octanoyl) transferase
VDIDDPKKARKICAMGVKTSRWVTLHGFALNVNTDLSYFDKMIPCGINDKAVTSMQKELKSVVDMDRVKSILREKLTELFQMKLS